MRFKNYSRLSAKKLQKDFSVQYLCLAACGEIGEAANLVKKQERDGVDNTTRILEELGDSLFYISQLAAKLNSSLEEVAAQNLEKIGSYDD